MEVTTLVKGFQEFLEKNYYPELLERVRKGENFLVIDFGELSKHDPELADLLLDGPEETLRIAELAVEQFGIKEDLRNFKIRVKNLAESARLEIRNIRSVHLNKFFFIEGVVKQKSDVKPQVTSAKFECPTCGNVISLLQLDKKFKEPMKCSCGRKGKFRLLSKELCDAQGLVLEEAAENLEGGEQPKRINVLLKSDLVSPLSEKRTNPGSKVRLVGTIKEVSRILRTGGQSTTFDLMFEANYTEPLEEDFTELTIKEEERNRIIEISKKPNLILSIVKAIAPSIYGHEKIKEALALQLVGGVRKTRNDGVVTRGDTHILLVGDPGAAKSQILKRINVVAPKGRYITGKGASLDYIEPLLIRQNGLLKTVPIGEFVDTHYVLNAENLMVPLSELIETLSLNLGTYKLEWKPIKYVYRHRVKKPLFKFTLETGRQITVTGDHSIFVLDNGKPAVKPAKKLKEKDCVLIPRIIRQNPCYNISLEVARLLGYYIAEGHTRNKDGSYKIEFTVNKREKEMIEDIQLCADYVLASKAHIYKHGENGARIVIYGKKAYNLFAFLLGEVLGKKAKEKRIPLCILNAQPDSQKAFIRAYLAGDAGVTKSHALMSDLLYLYLQFGIIATIPQRTDDKQIQIGHRVITSRGERYDLKSPRKGQAYKGRYKRPPFSAISNETLHAFYRGASSSGYTRATPDNAENKLLLERLNVVLTPVQGKNFRELFGEGSLFYVRSHPDLFQRQKDGRQIAVNIKEKGKQVIDGLQEIEKLSQSDLGFARINDIQLIQSSNEFVYDVSVPGFENFVGGFGGIICHNSGAGLSATVVKDEFLQGWSLEAGALVLAHKGIVMIDELDKMSKEDSWAMHEALEQQTITISKANIQATLRCETAVLAAANPKFGRFDQYDTVANQIDLVPTLINRFDLIFPIKDLPDPSQDEKMAKFILSLHQNRIEEPEITTAILRKYLAYAKQNYSPKLTDSAVEELREYFLKVRSSVGAEAARTVPISARQLEGLIRLSEAYAKLRLSNKVTREDARRAIEIMDYCLRQVAFDQEAGTFDVDRIATAVPAAQRNKIIIVKEVISDIENRIGKVIPLEDIIKEAENKNISKSEAEEIIQKLKRSGDLFEPRHGFISRI